MNTNETLAQLKARYYPSRMAKPVAPDAPHVRAIVGPNNEGCRPAHPVKK